MERSPTLHSIAAAAAAAIEGASSQFKLHLGSMPGFDETGPEAMAWSARNPVLAALSLSIRCHDSARWHTRDRRHAERLVHVAEMLETIACGLVDGALLAEEQYKE